MKKLIQSIATAARRCVHGFVSGTLGLVLNLAVWVAWFFDYRGTWHVVSMLVLAFWMGAKFRDLTANTGRQVRRESEKENS